jgi:hypothetical protein
MVYLFKRNREDIYVRTTGGDIYEILYCDDYDYDEEEAEDGKLS